MKPGRPPDVPMYQLKVTLLEVKPSVWRRLVVRSDTRLGKLHRILQVALGWTDSHLHEYIVGDTHYGVPDPEYDDLDVRSERTVPLYQVLLAPKATCIYEYDFGDGWQHELLLEQVAAPDGGHTVSGVPRRPAGMSTRRCRRRRGLCRVSPRHPVTAPSRACAAVDLGRWAV